MGIMVLFDSSKNKPRFRPKLTYNVLSKEQKNRYVTLCFKEKTPLTKEMVSDLSVAEIASVISQMRLHVINRPSKHAHEIGSANFDLLRPMVAEWFINNDFFVIKDKSGDLITASVEEQDCHFFYSTEALAKESIAKSEGLHVERVRTDKLQFWEKLEDGPALALVDNVHMPLPIVSDCLLAERKRAFDKKVQKFVDAGYIREIYSQRYITIFNFGEFCYLGCCPIPAENGEYFGLYLSDDYVKDIIEDQDVFFDLIDEYIENGEIGGRTFLLCEENFKTFEDFIENFKRQDPTIQIDHEMEQQIADGVITPLPSTEQVSTGRRILAFFLKAILFAAGIAAIAFISDPPSCSTPAPVEEVCEHNYEFFATFRKPTSKMSGIDDYKCEHCGAFEQRTTPAFEQSIGAAAISKTANYIQPHMIDLGDGISVPSSLGEELSSVEVTVELTNIGDKSIKSFSGYVEILNSSNKVLSTSGTIAYTGPSLDPEARHTAVGRFVTFGRGIDENYPNLLYIEKTDVKNLKCTFVIETIEYDS